MATDLTFEIESPEYVDTTIKGSVPPFYREVYEIVCPNQEHVDHDMFLKLLVKSSLPTTTLSQIWSYVENKQGYLTRTGLYHALALTALAQQGKLINEKILEKFTDQELPKPSLGDLSDLKALSVKVRRDKNPTVLGFSYHELCDLDTVKVELVPEKKGIILKHSEYEVTSRRFKVTVMRRYSDFLAFQEMLLVRFPYRMIPRLPPKKAMGASREFIEQRRRALRRFLNLVVRHPVMSDDQLIHYFLTFQGSDMQNKIKEHFKGMPDEFMISENAPRAKDLVPLDTQSQFGATKEHMRKLTDSVTKLREIAERMVLRTTNYAADMLDLGRELGGISADQTGVSTWATGTSKTWDHLKRGFKPLSVEYAKLAEKSSQHAFNEAEGVVEEITVFFDLLLAYRDLCERQEKNVVNDHQKALSKMASYKKKKMSVTLQGNDGAAKAEQIEQRILRQENEISNMENRNYFSLHCVQLETQLIHANLEGLYIALAIMATVESKAHSELGQVWQHIVPMIDSMLPSDINKNASTPSNPASLSNHTNGGPRKDSGGDALTRQLSRSASQHE